MNTPLMRIIRGEIAKHGPISFARFMELALYCPDYGFYEKERDNLGRGGDFYTSVSVGPLFGRLLAFQFTRWVEESGMTDGVLRLVEAGAHDGSLACDVLSWLKQQRPCLYERTEYCLLEVSARRRAWQRETLKDFGDQVGWLDAPDARRRPTAGRQFTVIVSNELLDAMPVRRLGWDAMRREWFEWGVTMEGDGFAWTRIRTVDSGLELPVPNDPALEAALPDGYTIEAGTAAERWWGEAAAALDFGKIITFDYGFDTPLPISASRAGGTVRSYSRHRQDGDVLANPGEQDITAHVNFARIEQVGLRQGLRTDVLEPQGRYLTGLAAEAWKPEACFGEWEANSTRQFQTLIHPQHLGQSFKVLVQSRC